MAIKMANIVDSLFSTHELRKEEGVNTVMQEIPLFTEMELVEVARSLQNKKAPGPCVIPVETIKAIVHVIPEIMLNMYNSFLKTGTFSEKVEATKVGTDRN